MQLLWERQRPSTQPPLERQRPHAPLKWGKQKLPGWCQPPSYDRPTWKPFKFWKRRPSKRKGTLANPSCRPVEQLFMPVPMSSRHTHVPHIFTNRKHIPHWSSNGYSTADYQFKGSISSPPHPRRPATATHPTGNKWQHLPRHEAELDCSGDREHTSHPGELSQWRQREEDPLVEHLRGSLLQGLRLVQHINWTYFRVHSPVLP